MANWQKSHIEKQFKSATKGGLIEAFGAAAKAYEFPTSLLMAIASRETNMRNIIGDGGHGYGIMQIDDRSFPDWCHSGQWTDASAGIWKGALVLDGKLEQVRAGQGKTLKVGGKTFTGASHLSNEQILTIAVAGYNSGLWAYYCYSKFQDADRKTTGKNYSSDVLSRAAIFDTLLSA